MEFCCSEKLDQIVSVAAINTVKAWGLPVHTAIFKMDNQQGPIVQHRESAQSYVAVWIGGELGG